MNTGEPSPKSRFLVRALLVVAAAMAVGALPFRALEGGAGVAALLLAGGAALVGALAGWLPRLWLLRSGRPEGPVLAAMAGLGARMLTTAALAFAVIRAAVVPALPFALSLVAIYLVLLVLEVREAVVEVSRMDASFGGRGTGR